MNRLGRVTDLSSPHPHPRIFMIEFSENMSEKMSPDTQKSREMAVIPLKVFINPKLIIVNYEEVYYRKPVRD